MTLNALPLFCNTAMFWCFLYLMFLNIQVFYTHEIQGVLNINQIDSTLQQSHFNPQFYEEGKKNRPKRSSDDSVILLNPDTTGVKMLDDSFDLPSTLDSNWDGRHKVNVEEEIKDTSSDLESNSKSTERKKRDANDESTTTPATPNSNANETSVSTSSTNSSLTTTAVSSSTRNENSTFTTDANNTATNASNPDTTSVTESTTDGSNTTEMNGMLVATYNATNPTESGWIKKMVALRNNSVYTLDFVAKVVGYNTDETVVQLSDDDERKPILNVCLERENYNNINIFDMGTYGLHFNSTVNGKWIKIRYTLNTKQMSTENKKDNFDKMEITGNWTLKFELRSGSNVGQEKGVYLDQVILMENVLAETINEHFQHTTATTERTTTTPPDDTKLTHIFGTRGAEIFMIVLVLLFGLGLIGVEIKYVQIRKKLKEYKLNGGETANPAYDNPVYGGGHQSPER